MKMNDSPRMISLLACVLCATACRGESSDYTHLQYHSTSSATGDTCDGPCPEVVVDSCSISAQAETTVLVQMLTARPAQQWDDPCAPPVEYNGGYTISEVHVVDTLRGTSVDGQEFPVVFLSSRFRDLDWAQGDFLLLSTRTDGGERFATAAVHVTPTTDRVDTPQASSDNVRYKLPSEISSLKAELADISANFANECPDLAPNRMTDAEFTGYARGGSGRVECSDGADIADEFADDPNDRTD